MSPLHISHFRRCSSDLKPSPRENVCICDIFRQSASSQGRNKISQKPSQPFVLMEQVIFRLGPRSRRSVRGDVVQDLVVAEIRQLGFVGEMRRVAHCHGYLQAADAGFIDHVALMLKDVVSKIVSARQHNMHNEILDPMR